MCTVLKNKSSIVTTAIIMIQNIPILMVLRSSFLHLRPLATSNLLSIIVVLPFLSLHINGILGYVVFYVWLLSFIQNSVELHPHCCVYLLVIRCFYRGVIATTWMYHRMLIYLPIDRHLGGFQFIFPYK